MISWNLLKRHGIPAAGALLTLAAIVGAQEPKSESSPAPGAATAPDSQEPAGLAEIRAAARAYLQAVYNGDYATAAKYWNPDGDYVDSAGRKHKVRELFAQRLASAEPGNAGKPTATKPADRAAASEPKRDDKRPDSRPADPQNPTITATAKTSESEAPQPVVGTLRLVTPDVAIEDGSWRPAGGESPRRASSRFTAIWMRRDGHWRLDSLRESLVTNVSPAARLHVLEWLIGDWTATQGSAHIHMSCAWSPDKNFIVRELRAGPADDQLSLMATQRIGWDPISGRIKSWSFESDGGWGDAFWGRLGDSWSLRSMTVHPDGTQVTATNTYTLTDRDHLRLDSTDVLVGGEPRPDAHIDFYRQP